MIFKRLALGEVSLGTGSSCILFLRAANILQAIDLQFFIDMFTCTHELVHLPR